ncbi:DegT/DnrJ/EryC1/StrS family aminotransferase [Candidatus Woesearchaeota archaeon]|nr:DegT/DnrJ/EryC1/StrS family aminotransferase [Candidatus Woesearchaeota archaeon]
MTIPIAKPLIGEEEKRAVLEVLSSGMLAQGEKVAAFEKAFADFIGVKHAIATSNGTTALHAVLVGLGIGAGDEVITSPFSFIATANVIKMCGAMPVFVDVDKTTMNIDPHLIEAKITPQTKAIMPVHLFGLPVEIDMIMAIAEKHHLHVVEDACQAHGAEWNGQKVGSFGIGCFSFYGTKNMTTGEGGMITTDDNALAVKLRKIISHGSERKYVHSSLGYNYRMTDLAAAIGLEQLKKLGRFTTARRENAKQLTARLSTINGIITPSVTDGHVFHQYTIRITEDFSLKRDRLIEELQTRGIGSAVFYPIPIHRQEAYSSHQHLSFPFTEKIAREVLSLPVHPAVTQQDINLIGNVFLELSQR